MNVYGIYSTEVVSVSASWLTGRRRKKLGYLKSCSSWIAAHIPLGVVFWLNFIHLFDNKKRILSLKFPVEVIDGVGVTPIDTWLDGPVLPGGKNTHNSTSGTVEQSKRKDKNGLLPASLFLPLIRQRSRFALYEGHTQRSRRWLYLVYQTYASFQLLLCMSCHMTWTHTSDNNYLPMGNYFH